MGSTACAAHACESYIPLVTPMRCKLPDLWKTATVVPVPKKHPPGSLENDIRPISLTPILAKAFEGIVLNWVDDVITP